MFQSIIESGRQLAGRLSKYDITRVPVGQRMFESEVTAWFKAAGALVGAAFGQNSPEHLRWKQFQVRMWEKRNAERVSSGRQHDVDWNKHATITSFGDCIGLLTEFQMLLDAKPTDLSELRTSLKGFRTDHPDPTRTAFVMMQFGSTPAHTKIVTSIRRALVPFGITGLRADQKQYHDDLFWNILTYVYGCGLGIAVFERLEAEEFSPNVALEVGYMLALPRPVCLLKDKTLKTLQTDLIGKLYRAFDPQKPEKTIPEVLSQWLSDKGWQHVGNTSPNQH